MMQTSQSKGSSSLTGQPVTMSVNDLLKMDFSIVGSKIKVVILSAFLSFGGGELAIELRS